MSTCAEPSRAVMSQPKRVDLGGARPTRGADPTALSTWSGVSEIPWFKVDDNFAMHTKAVMAGNAAIGLWVRAGAWSMQTLSDGFIPDAIVTGLGTKGQADRLVSVGLWDRLPTGYAFHQWDDRNPSKEDVQHMAEVKGSAATYGNHVRCHRNWKSDEEDCSCSQKETAW